MNSRKCEICNVDVHRASYVKHLRSKKDIKNEKMNNMFIPEWLFQELMLFQDRIEKKSTKYIIQKH